MLHTGWRDFEILRRYHIPLTTVATMIKTKFFTSACVTNERNRIADIRFFYALVREQLKEKFEQPKYKGKGVPTDLADSILNTYLISIHEHNRHFTITERDGYCFAPMMLKVWKQMGEPTHIHFVCSNRPWTLGDILVANPTYLTDKVEEYRKKAEKKSK